MTSCCVLKALLRSCVAWRRCKHVPFVVVVGAGRLCFCGLLSPRFRDSIQTSGLIKKSLVSKQHTQQKKGAKGTTEEIFHWLFSTNGSIWGNLNSVCLHWIGSEWISITTTKTLKVTTQYEVTMEKWQLSSLTNQSQPIYLGFAVPLCVVIIALVIAVLTPPPPHQGVSGHQGTYSGVHKDGKTRKTVAEWWKSQLSSAYSEHKMKIVLLKQPWMKEVGLKSGQRQKPWLVQH